MMVAVLPVRAGAGCTDCFLYPEFRLGYILPDASGHSPWASRRLSLCGGWTVHRIVWMGCRLGMDNYWAALRFCAIAAIDIPLGIAIHFCSLRALARRIGEHCPPIC